MKLTFAVAFFSLALPVFSASIPRQVRVRCRTPSPIPSPSAEPAPEAQQATTSEIPTLSQVPTPVPQRNHTAPNANANNNNSNNNKDNNHNNGGNNGNNSGGGNGGGDNNNDDDGGNLDGGLGGRLFPSFHSYRAGFTTAAGVSVPGVRQVALSDGALNVIQPSGLSHNVVQRDGKTAWEAFYPRGSYKPSARPLGGFGFYVGGSNEFKAAIDGGAKEVILSYVVQFERGFQFNMGGKMPGGFGGVGDAAHGCSGGRQSNRNACFDARLMWRTNGDAELYTYLPPTDTNTKAQLAVPQSFGNPEFGFSVGRGLYTFPPGQWVTVTERLKLNDVGQRNGEVRVWIDGQSIIDVRGLEVRTSGDSRIQGMHFQTFFGGGSLVWASPKDQRAWFADVSGAVIN